MIYVDCFLNIKTALHPSSEPLLVIVYSSFCILFVCFKYLFIWLYQVLVVAHGIFSCSMWDLVPWPGIEPGPPELGVWSHSRWTTSGVPLSIYCLFLSLIFCKNFCIFFMWDLVVIAFFKYLYFCYHGNSSLRNWV